MGTRLTPEEIAAIQHKIEQDRLMNETEADRQHAKDLAEGITCNCWTYAPQPDCVDRGSTRHYWAW